MELPPDVPPEAAAFLREIGYLHPDRLTVGDAAPELVLATYAEGTPITVGVPDAILPTVLVFGSYT